MNREYKKENQYFMFYNDEFCHYSQVNFISLWQLQIAYVLFQVKCQEWKQWQNYQITPYKAQPAIIC